MTEPNEALHVHINLGGIQGRVVRDVRRIVHMTAAALSAGEGASKSQLLPAPFQYNFNPPLSDAELNAFSEAYPPWVLRTAFRDLAELVASILEEAFAISCYWKLAKQVGERGIFMGEAFHREITRPSQRFHRLTLPDKLSTLADNGVILQPGHDRIMTSINAVRNCLVHRDGIVGDRDLDSTGKLVLHWIRVALQVRRPDGSLHEITLPYTTVEGDQMVVRHGPAERSFAKGERLDIDVQTFADVGWTVSLLAQKMALALERSARTLGLPVDPPPADQPPAAPAI